MIAQAFDKHAQDLAAVFGSKTIDTSPRGLAGPAQAPEHTVFVTEANVPGGVKFDADKPKWSLMPRGVLSQVVEVLTFGAKKYSPNNWMKVDPERYYDALHRHVDAWRNGEKIDAESGKHHLAHALCCLLFLLWQEDNPQSKVAK